MTANEPGEDPGMNGSARRAEGLPLPSKFLQEGEGTDLYVDL